MEFTTDHDICKRFGLNHGQFFSDYNLKNVRWFLNGQSIGFGDLRSKDILRISEELKENEVFEGYNEHHMSPWMTRENPVIRIDHENVEFPEVERVKPETRRKVRLGWKD